MPPRVRPPVWLWFNLLSLDAPLVALVWQDFLARCYPTVLHPSGRLVLGLTVWAIYLADRLLDVRHPATLGESIRHRFYRRHHVFARTLLVTVVATDLLLTCFWLRPAVLDNGLLLTAGVITYLGIFPLRRWGATAWKKPLAALLFTAGTFLIAWTGAGRSVRDLVWPAVAFCALCLGNLLMIGHWSQAAPSRLFTFHRAWISVLCISVLFLAGCIAAAFGASWFTAVICSAAGLCALARWDRKLSPAACCVLADVVLLTPLLFR